jgi:UMF1 family MFS transporter
MIPKHKSSQFFGFFSIFEKFAGVAGPAVFAASVTVFGNSRAAVLTIIVFFILGAIVLTRVNVEEGEAQARAAVAS